MTKKSIFYLFLFFLNTFFLADDEKALVIPRNIALIRPMSELLNTLYSQENQLIKFNPQNLANYVTRFHDINNENIKHLSSLFLKKYNENEKINDFLKSKEHDFFQKNKEIPFIQQLLLSHRQSAVLTNLIKNTSVSVELLPTVVENSVDKLVDNKLFSGINRKNAVYLLASFLAISSLYKFFYSEEKYQKKYIFSFFLTTAIPLIMNFYFECGIFVSVTLPLFIEYLACLILMKKTVYYDEPLSKKNILGSIFFKGIVSDAMIILCSILCFYFMNKSEVFKSKNFFKFFFNGAIPSNLIFSIIGIPFLIDIMIKIIDHKESFFKDKKNFNDQNIFFRSVGVLTFSSIIIFFILSAQSEFSKEQKFIESFFSFFIKFSNQSVKVLFSGILPLFPYIISNFFLKRKIEDSIKNKLCQRFPDSTENEKVDTLEQKLKNGLSFVEFENLSAGQIKKNEKKYTCLEDKTVDELEEEIQELFLSFETDIDIERNKKVFFGLRNYFDLEFFEIWAPEYYTILKDINIVESDIASFQKQNKFLIDSSQKTKLHLYDYRKKIENLLFNKKIKEAQYKLWGIIVDFQLLKKYKDDINNGEEFLNQLKEYNQLCCKEKIASSNLIGSGITNSEDKNKKIFNDSYQSINNLYTYIESIIKKYTKNKENQDDKKNKKGDNQKVSVWKSSKDFFYYFLPQNNIPDVYKENSNEINRKKIDYIKNNFVYFLHYFMIEFMKSDFQRNVLEKNENYIQNDLSENFQKTFYGLVLSFFSFLENNDQIYDLYENKNFDKDLFTKINNFLESEIKKYDEFKDSESNASDDTVNSNSEGSFKNLHQQMRKEE